MDSNEETKITSFMKQKTVQTPMNGELSKDTAKLSRNNFVIPDVDIIDVLGEGGMGVVYKGRQTYIERDVAVKVMKPVEDSSFEERFKREAQILANLAHPNIVSCYHAGVTNGYCYIVMEFIQGMDLHQYIKKNGTLSEKQALYVIKSLAGALEYAQEKGIMHRDIKCENVLLEKIDLDGSISAVFDVDVDFPYRVKLVDLGLAKGYSQTSNDERNITEEGNIVGTPSNMAPEQFSSDESVDYRADIYALGCVLFFMLSANRAFSSRNILALVNEKTQSHAPSIKSKNENISDRTSQFIEHLLDPKAENRSQTYEEIIEFCDGKMIKKRGSSNKKSSNTVIFTGVICLVIIGIFFLKPKDSKIDSSKNRTPKNISQTNVKNTQSTSNTSDKNTRENVNPKQSTIKKVKWDSLSTALFEDDYLNRLQGWERNGGSSWAPSEEDKGVIGVASGTIFRALPQTPWIVTGIIKSLSPKDRKYGVVIDCPELSYDVTIQNISSDLSIVNINEEGKKRKILSSKTHKGPKIFSYEITYQNNSLTFVLNDKIIHQQKCKSPLQINLLVEKVQGVYFFVEMTKGQYQ